MAFEEFRKRAAPLAKTPTVSIQKHGTISLNRPALDLLGNAKFVVFMYDRENNLIGLRPSASESDGYAIRPAVAKGQREEDATSFVVSGRAFLKFYGITPEASVRFEATLNSDGVLCVPIDDGGEVVSSNRAGTGSTYTDEEPF